jgi:glycosyltransferase involved in cell wall biosynthesis
MEREFAPYTDLVSLVRLWRLLRKLRPDATEFSTPKAGVLGTLAARLAGVPRRVYLLRGLKVETAIGFRRLVLLESERLAMACAHVVICNSASLRAKVLELGLAPAAKLRVLGDGSSKGVDLDRFAPGPDEMRSRLNIPPAAPVVGFVGKLTRDKGLPELIDAFDQILMKEPLARLLLVGWFDVAEDGVDERLRLRIQNHPSIISTGFVADTAPYYRAMDLLVLPTRREGFPNVVLEAAATGVPVITTRATGSRDSVVPGVTGLLISPRSADEISKAVLKLLCDPQRSRMGEAGRTWVMGRFEKRHVLGMTVAFYLNLLKPRENENPGRLVMDSAERSA